MPLLVLLLGEPSGLPDWWGFRATFSPHGGRAITAVQQLLHPDPLPPIGFFIKEKPPCKTPERARELWNRSKLLGAKTLYSCGYEEPCRWLPCGLSMGKVNGKMPDFHNFLRFLWVKCRFLPDFGPSGL